MKRKMTILFLCIAIMLQMTACGAARPAASDLERRKEQAREELDANHKEDTASNEADTEGSAEEMPEETGEDAAFRSGIRFGSAEAQGYRGFQYLAEERISTSRKTSRQETVFSVYIPKEDHPRISGTSARSEYAGVYVKVDLEPYLQYKAKNYSLQNNLQKYVDGEMAYYDTYYDINIGNIREIEDGAVCEVSYMEYDSWNEEYVPHYCAYGLYRFGDDVMALVTVTVNEEDVTEETEALIAELNDFYELELGWNQSFAQDKQQEFEDKYNRNNFEVYSLAFALPDGWAIDEELTDGYETVITPGGDLQMAADCIYIMEPEEAYGIVDMFLEDMESLEELWEEEFEDELESLKIEDIGITFLGRTIRMTVVEHYDDEADAGVIYMAEDDDNLYMVYAYTHIDMESGQEAVISDSLTEALELFFETGRIVDSMM
ncbi:MAG: hypothetical protein NC314_04025 [Roseburia sp.]|nr:hypothetical protein [Roseburia sp.]MCM1241985.1 hypothetical protein [Roseburia sp.]